MVFNLAKASPTNVDELINIHHKAMQDDPLYTNIFTNVPTEEQYRLFSHTYTSRSQQPHCKFVKINDSQSG